MGKSPTEDLIKNAMKGKHAKLQDLIDQGGDVNHRMNNGWTALNKAAQKGYVEVVRVLIANNVDPFVEDEDDMTAKQIAEEKGFSEIVELLQAHEESYAPSDTPTVTVTSPGKEPEVEFINDEFGNFLRSCNLAEIRPRFDSQGMDLALLRRLLTQRGEEAFTRQLMNDVRLSQTQADRVIHELQLIARDADADTPLFPGKNWAQHSKIFLGAAPGAWDRPSLANAHYMHSREEVEEVTLKLSPSFPVLRREHETLVHLARTMEDRPKFFAQAVDLSEEGVFERLVSSGGSSVPLHGLPLKERFSTNMEHHLRTHGAGFNDLTKVALSQSLLEAVQQMHQAQRILLNLSPQSLYRFPGAPDWRIANFETVCPTHDPVPRRFDAAADARLWRPKSRSSSEATVGTTSSRLLPWTCGVLACVCSAFSWAKTSSTCSDFEPQTRPCSSRSTHPLLSSRQPSSKPSIASWAPATTRR
jgi:hypothetical protein